MVASIVCSPACLGGDDAWGDATGDEVRDARPADEHPSVARFDLDDFASRERMLGDLGGVRPWLEARGIVVESSLVADLSKNISGGVNPAGTFRHLFGIGLTFNLDAIAGLEGGSVFIDLKTREGQDGSVETGDLQAYSNIDAPDFTVIYEAWYQQRLFDDALRIKLGKIDANTEFGYVDFGGEFIHSSPGLSPTGFVTPQYPETAVGVMAFYEAMPQGDAAIGWTLGGGLFDGSVAEGFRTGALGPSNFFGDPADLYMVGEVGACWRLGNGTLPGRAAAGAWHHTGGFARFDGGTESRTDGGYVVLDQLVYKEKADAGDEQGVGLFAQFGWADGSVAAIKEHVGLGFQWSGMLPGRERDVWGLMGSWVELSDAPGAGFTDHAEVAIEWFYKYQATAFVSLKPDVQYIVDPGGVGLTNAWVVTLRVEAVF